MVPSVDVEHIIQNLTQSATVPYLDVEHIIQNLAQSAMVLCVKIDPFLMVVSLLNTHH